ncbi:TadE/TadG family type IV pilus assembly protein [Microbacterium sp. 179-I 3D4 NHS]|uniref:TadE/TadG family type IV pilus assembly protein n=1 Tax=Microbacterium sp. 179-I 3D4 NHS TaxID=3142381 RepID=UPI0039A2B305
MEFVLVGTLLTVLTLAVLQLAFAIYVRNVAHDAAVEGAYHAALADTSLEDGAERTRLVLSRAIGASYADDIEVRAIEAGEQDLIQVTVRATLPLIGLIGIPSALEVNAYAPGESLEAEAG